MPAAAAHQLLLTTDPRVLIEQFLNECADVGVKDIAGIRRIAIQTIAHLRGSPQARSVTEQEQELQQRWYDALTAGTIDWSVYATDYYLAEMWACWTVYSRKYLMQMSVPKVLPPHGLVSHLGQVNRIVDLGCGIGFTTAALHQMFPMADVWATNLGGAAQTEVARRMGLRFRFHIVEQVKEIAMPADLVFASEYFEHIPAPLDHLREVLDTLRPRALLIANSFGTLAIGHFHRYQIDGQPVSGVLVSKLFNAMLRQRGYVKVKTKMWNQRPAYWVRA